MTICVSRTLVRFLLVCFLLILAGRGYAAQWSLKSNVDAHAAYDDNIFVTRENPDSVSSIVVTPSIDGIVKEAQWEADLNARIRSNKYSDHNLSSNDQFLDLTGRYNGQRSNFSLNANYDLDSSLSTESSDFGLVGRRINRKNKSIAPQYTRMLTERLALVLSYSYSDVDYLDAGNTGFTPYIVKTGSGSFIYNLTEKDKLTLSMQALDYKSRNDTYAYTLLTSRFGIEHQFTEVLSADFSAGVSRQNTSSQVSQAFNFFGNIIVQTQTASSKNRGYVLDTGIKRKLESGQIEGRLSRDNTTNSFGGLNQVDTIKLNYNHRLSSLWRYLVRGRYEDVTAIGTGTRSTDRRVLFFETIMFYSLNRNWSVNGSYRYVQRIFTDTGTNTSGKAPVSNRIYVGMTYNFPTFSTF